MLTYILNTENTWLYKIGHTKADSSKDRIKSCQTGNAHKILLIWEYKSEYAKQLETMAHNHYSYLRKSGEWFDFEDINIEEVKNKIITFENTLKILKNNEVSD